MTGRLNFLYHELRAEGSEYAYVVKTSEFARQVELFRRLQLGGGAGLMPGVTFDDGDVSNYEQALPVLQEFGVTARFFITVGWTAQRAGYMNWEQLRGLRAAGQEIGAHGWTHTLLTHCDPAQLKKELLDARLKLEDELGAAVTTISLPGGRYNQRVLEACREHGYTQVFTSVPQASTAADDWLVGRLNLVGGTTLVWLEKVLDPSSGVLAALERKDRIKGMAKRVLGDTLYAKVWSMVNRSEPDAGAGA
jgi:peptidoglycan/xylan/chitin deacetylase (PgdA/CDA1 family)